MRSQVVPDRLVVLTFDDGNRSDATVVAPLLERYGFGATFFITEGMNFLENKTSRLTWPEVRALHEAGFEIGNHTAAHGPADAQPTDEFRRDIEHIEQRCAEHGIPHPTSFCYPGYRHRAEAAGVLADMGYRFARRGVAPEYPHALGRGSAYDPATDHPLLIPTTAASGPRWRLENFIEALDQARDGKIAVFTFHGVPDLDHPWVHTDPGLFEECMGHLHTHGYRVIAMRDLAEYVHDETASADPYAGIQARMTPAPVDLTTEGATSPVGIDAKQPRFGWKIRSARRGERQTAYRVCVSGSRSRAADDDPDVWDSGKVMSRESAHVPYGGPALRSDQTYYWSARTWDADDTPSDLSDVATFDMGLLDSADWVARWIGTDARISAPLLRKEFQIDGEMKRARAYVSGLGYAEITVNGERVGDHVLDPATTYYDNIHALDIASRVLYVTHDVTALLTPGANAIGVMLGNGWYSADDDDPPGRTAYADRPILLLQLNIELVDGRSIHVVSDETWRASAGPITANDYAGGEEYDARLEQPGWDCVAFDDAAWLAADPADAPSGRLVAQSLEPTRIVEKLRPTRMLDSAAGGVIFDMGQHFSGWVQLRAQGRRGTKLTLCHAGRVNYDTVSLDCRNNDFFQPAGQTDTYILKGGGVETWHPRFTLHGFRYVEVLGDAGELTLDSVEGHVVHSAVETSGTFHCANDLLNRIHQNACWTFRSSLQGMPQDASDRAERVGWLGDTGFVAEDYIVNFDTARFWAKWLDDIADAQKPDGEVPHVVPPHWGPDRYVEWPAWQSTYTVIAWHLYQYYGDLRILADHFEGIRRQVEYFRAKSDRHIMRHGLGDHMEPRGDGSSSHFPERTPGPLTGTAYYYFSAWILSQASAALGNDADAERYTKLAEDVREAFNGEFFDPETNQYATGSQTANSLALYLNLVPEGREQEVLANLVDDILNRRRGHLSTGIIGTDALEQALPRYGRADVMYRIATQTTFPSWGYGVVNGATTIWEDWEGSSQRSLSMKMLASVEKFLYRDVAGIGPAEPGYRAIAIRPQLTAALKHASAAVETVYGRAAVDWTKEDDALWLGVTVPPNTTARVSVPKDGLEDVTVTEDGRPIWRDGAFVAGTSGITRGDEDGRYIHFDVDAGAYAFQLTGRPSSARMEDTQ